MRVRKPQVSARHGEEERPQPSDPPNPGAGWVQRSRGAGCGDITPKMNMHGLTETPKTPIHLFSLGDPTLGAVGSEGPRCTSARYELDTLFLSKGLLIAGYDFLSRRWASSEALVLVARMETNFMRQVALEHSLHPGAAVLVPGCRVF